MNVTVLHPTRLKCYSAATSVVQAVVHGANHAFQQLICMHMLTSFSDTTKPACSNLSFLLQRVLNEHIASWHNLQLYTVRVFSLAFTVSLLVPAISAARSLHSNDSCLHHLLIDPCFTSHNTDAFMLSTVHVRRDANAGLQVMPTIATA